MKDENKFTVSIDTNNDKLCRTVFDFGRFDDIKLKANSLEDIRDHDLVYRYNVGLVMWTCVNLEILFYQAVITINTDIGIINDKIDNAIKKVRNLSGTKIKYCNDKIQLFIPELVNDDECIHEDIKFLFDKSWRSEHISIMVY